MKILRKSHIKDENHNLFANSQTASENQHKDAKKSHRVDENQQITAKSQMIDENHEFFARNNQCLQQNASNAKKNSLSMLLIKKEDMANTAPENAMMKADTDTAKASTKSVCSAENKAMQCNQRLKSKNFALANANTNIIQKES